MHWIDWSVVVVIVAALAWVAVYTKRYTRSVADFLAANRSAGRYLLTISDGASGLGAITMIALFQQYYQAGFPAMWWSFMLAPLGLLFAISGFIIYRYRETRAMTMAQFFEIRYSKRFRIFAGVTAWLSGIINYGIFPAVTARFFIGFCGIPVYTLPIGGFELNLTLATVMFIMLALAVTFTLSGGQIAVMVTDFLQGQLVNIGFLALMVFLLFKFGWGNIVDVLKEAPAGESMLDPFDQAKIPDFNVWFFVMMVVFRIYTYLAWQGSQGYNSAASSPHEAKMSKILGSWRALVTAMIALLMPVCAYVLLKGDFFPETAQAVQDHLSLFSGTEQGQLRTPLVLAHVLPVGLVGLFCAVMLAAAVSTDDTYLHSWGSIFIQDVVLPLRKNKTPLTPEQHIKWLRRSIIGVAVFAWCFSLIFPLQDYIFMFWNITGAIYMGGAGSVIIGGLYWKRGTTAGAWAGMVTGGVLAIAGILLQNVVWPFVLPGLKETFVSATWLQNLPGTFPFNGTEMMFYTSIVAVLAYIGVSFMTKVDPAFSMDRMLHRGEFADKGDHADAAPPARGWKALGMGPEFSKWDRVIYVASIVWMLMWFIPFLIGTVYGLFIGDIPLSVWIGWWLYTVLVFVGLGAVMVVWFLWGGILDLRRFFGALGVEVVDAADDGTVDHSNETSD